MEGKLAEQDEQIQNLRKEADFFKKQAQYTFKKANTPEATNGLPVDEQV